MAANTIKANISGVSTTPTDVTPSTILDTFGTQVGSILYRGSSGWAALTSGTAGQILTANGTTAAPSWTSLGLGTMASQNANAVSITGGTISGVAITASTINSTPIGASTPSTGAFTNLSASGTVTLGTITGATWNGNAIAILYGGTGATDATTARSNLSAAKSGANSDITSLTGLTTPLSENQGGTGYGSYTTGDILYASSSSTLARLNDVATGNALISGGAGVAPSYGKIGLTTHVSGTLPVANGGTGATTLTGYLYGNGTGAFTASATIPNAGLTNSTVTIGSTSISLGGTATTLSGLTTLTLTQDPTANLEASTKQYVDNQVATVSNQTFHTACYASTTANLNATYSNGTSGVGATLTNSGALAAFTTDGTSPTTTSRILVQFQTSAAQNGIYTVTTVGSGAVAWVLTRATDFNTVGTGPNFIQTGSAVFVNNGSLYGASGWVMNTTGTITVGTTSLVWAQTSSSSSVTVSSPLIKTGSDISLGTVPTTLGGTGLATLTAYNVMLGNGTGNVAFAAPGTTGYPLLSTGAASNPAFGQLSLTAGVTGTLPVANGGTGTATTFTTGSVIFAGPSGVYAQDNARLFFDDTNNRLGINTASPQTQLTVLSNTQTTTPTAALPAGTDIYVVGANAANTRVTQDAYGTGNYPVYTGRQARGTAAAPTASQSGDTLSQFTGRGYGATVFATASTGRFDVTAAENFTDTAQGTYASVFTTAIGANSPTEAFRFGPAGQFGIGAGTYGTNGYSLVSGGASAAPTWSQVSLTAGITGVLPVANGGTNISSYAVGDLIYASGATTLSKLADVATGNVLISGGVTTAPSYGKVGLTTHVSGTLPVGNGGTGVTTTPTDGQLLIGSTSGSGYTVATLTQGTNISITNGTGSISIAVSGTPSFATSITTPIVYGGTAASSSLTLQSTSGVGTTDSILFKVGNNGATTAMTISTAGLVTANNFGSSSSAITGGSINGTTVGATTASTGAFTTLSASSTVSGTGFSTYLASPPAIGGTAAAAGAFTTLSASSTVSGTGFSTYLASPPAIGGTTAAAGAFTTLSASSTVSGTGFSTYLASPPAIGGTTAAAGAFTTLSASSTVSGTGFSTYLASPPAIGGTTAAAGTFTTLIDSIGNVRTVPLNSQTTGYTLVSTDSGKCISITTGGVTVPASIFTAGQTITIYNNSASSQTITQGASVTMYNVGTATTGNRTLAQRGLCTVFCVASNTFVITGGGLT
jgi:hypothetical protein